MGKTKSIIYSALFITLIFICGQIKFTVLTVPYTLQTFAVMLLSCMLGLKKALITVSIYIFMGLFGLPVFTKGGGFAYVLEPTFGYIAGFIPAVIIAGALRRKAEKSFFTLFALLALSGTVILLSGALYALAVLKIYSQGSFSGTFFTGYFFMFVPAEIIKAFAAALIYGRLRRYAV